MDRVLSTLARIAPGPIIGVIAIGGLYLMSGTPGAAHRVPDLEGLQVNPAIARAAEEGYFTKVVLRPGRGVAGTVVAQDPDPFDVRDKGTTITLRVTEGVAQVKVPDVRGVEVNEARRRLDRGNVTPGTVTYRQDEKVATDRVITTVPAPGRLVDVGAHVELIVAS